MLVMNYLLVVAHPDDEVLGAGATVNKLVKEGHRVDVCIMSSGAAARAMRPSDDELNDDFNGCIDSLGVTKAYMGDFPNIQLNTVPHLKLVQFIEKAIESSMAEVVITHHPSDTNNDHLHTSLATQAAVRLFQRRSDVKPLRELWYMEVLSSTEWSLNSAMNKFEPNLFVEIGKAGVEKKLEALSRYRGVMRPYPHPRSNEAIEGLAAYRGAQGGCCYAEAFECAFRRIV
jgi:LmbE family N-acetylglucosaminyl deacetylase